uniref:Uncharacterized protein n=1 Tax=Ixodes ricinus TaxID=34613 RepID=A0A6B0USX3_IXORI
MTASASEINSPRRATTSKASYKLRPMFRPSWGQPLPGSCHLSCDVTYLVWSRDEGRVPKFTRSYSRVRVLYLWRSKTYPRPAFFSLCCHVIQSAGVTRIHLGKIWNTAEWSHLCTMAAALWGLLSSEDRNPGLSL